jgi:carboxypeptidase Q
MHIRPGLSALALLSILVSTPALSQVPVDLEMATRIKQEGLERSSALELYHMLTDEIGGRLTGSPSYDQAAAWARDRFEEWGLQQARLEPFEFGRGWSLEKLSVEMLAPRYMPLIGYAEAWTPSIDGVLTGSIVYVGDKTASQIEAMAADRTHPPTATRVPRCGSPATGVGSGRGAHR